MICIKYDQKLKKPKFWTFEVFRFFKKNLGFLKPFSSPGLYKQAGYGLKYRVSARSFDLSCEVAQYISI